MSGKNCSHAEKALIKSVSSKCLLGYTSSWWGSTSFTAILSTLRRLPCLCLSSVRTFTWCPTIFAIIITKERACLLKLCDDCTHTHMGTWNSSNAIIQVVWIKQSSPSTLFVSISICDGNSSYKSSACNPWPFHEYALMMFNSMCLLDIFTR